MRVKYKKHVLLFLTMMCMSSFSVRPVFAQPQGTNGTELQVAQPEQLEIQLGAEWAGVEFQMKTDAGLYPDTIPVGQDGVLRHPFPIHADGDGPQLLALLHWSGYRFG